MKITKWFTHPHAILDVYDFLLSDQSNLSYIKKCLSFILAVNGGQDFEANKLHPYIIKSAPHGSRALIKAFWIESMHLCTFFFFLYAVIYSFRCHTRVHKTVAFQRMNVSFGENMLVKQVLFTAKENQSPFGID